MTTVKEATIVTKWIHSKLKATPHFRHLIWIGQFLQSIRKIHQHRPHHQHHHGHHHHPHRHRQVLLHHGLTNVVQETKEVKKIISTKIGSQTIHLHQIYQVHFEDPYANKMSKTPLNRNNFMKYIKFKSIKKNCQKRL